MMNAKYEVKKSITLSKTTTNFEKYCRKNESFFLKMLIARKLHEKSHSFTRFLSYYGTSIDRMQIIASVKTHDDKKDFYT